MPGRIRPLFVIPAKVNGRKSPRTEKSVVPAFAQGCPGNRKWLLRLDRNQLKVVSHGRYVTFQMAEVAVPRQMFADILSLIARLRASPAPA